MNKPFFGSVLTPVDYFRCRCPHLLQKKLMIALYILQGTCLMSYDRRAFSEAITAWQYGPMVPYVHEVFRGEKYVPSITKPITIAGPLGTITDGIVQLVNHHKASDMIEDARQDPLFQSTPSGHVIYPNRIKEHFEKLAA